MNQPQFNTQRFPQQQPSQGAQVQRPFGAQAPQPAGGQAQFPGRGFAPAPARPAAPAPGQPQQFRPAQQPAFRGGPAQGQAFQQQAPMQRNNPFAGIGQVRAKQDVNYDRTGDYIQRIELVKWIGPGREQPTQDNKDKIIIVKHTLGIVGPAEDGNTHRIGEETTHAITNDTRYNYFLPEVKRFVMNVVGCPEEAVTDEMISEICDTTKNPFGGIVVQCSNRFKATQRTMIVLKNYKRRLRSHEIQQEIAPEVVARFFPGDTLARMAASENQEAQVPQPMQQFEQQQQPDYGQSPQGFVPQGQPQLPPPPNPFQQPQQGFAPQGWRPQ